MRRLLILFVLLSATPAVAADYPSKFYAYKMRLEQRRENALAIRRRINLSRPAAIYPIAGYQDPMPRWNFGGPIEYSRSGSGPELYMFDIDPPAVTQQCDR